ncbi:MAG TPA: Gfo/Idh/MocA family oxidoreductase [Tepidisphaeraceae bacterium]|jgi:predicted dehydrogenase|nr:Gfo/Idh/MocA family oxidoreductase [Tepidisphaeraceae bacterium]
MHQPISRRRLLQGSAAAAAAVGISRFTALSYGQIVGSNNDIRIAVIGFNGRGNSHIDAWRKIKGVRLVGLCDADKAVLERGYKRVMAKAPANQPATQPSKAATSELHASAAPPRIEKYSDLRKLLDNKDIDAISTATPNHWHALVTVWGCQAGKDVYVEKPTCHEIWEGRQAVDAARKYNRIVQAGTQSRSSRSLTEAVEWIQAGNLGKIKIARGLCYKRRGSIGKLVGEPKVPETVDLDLWCGPSPLEKPHREHFHYDWHWFWQTGNGDIGNQGIHQMDVARWGLGKNELAPSVISVGGRFGYDDDGQTPNTQYAIHNYGDSLLIFEVRGLPTHPGSPRMDRYRPSILAKLDAKADPSKSGSTTKSSSAGKGKAEGESVGTVIECENGFLSVPAEDTNSGTTAYDNKGEEIRKFNEKGGKAEPHFQGDHFANFIDAVRSRKVSDLHADIEKGFLSSALCHTSNISYRLGQKADPDAIKAAMKADAAAMDTFERFKEHLAANNIDISMDKATLGMPLKVDTKAERFIDNAEANALVKRSDRAPFVVPDKL